MIGKQFTDPLYLICLSNRYISLRGPNQTGIQFSTIPSYIYTPFLCINLVKNDYYLKDQLSREFVYNWIFKHKNCYFFSDIPGTFDKGWLREKSYRISIYGKIVILLLTFHYILRYCIYFLIMQLKIHVHDSLVVHLILTKSGIVISKNSPSCELLIISCIFFDF